jgi:16S rRNA (adenine1518-N6/adenine1519-N6)-dimethyltransferase
VHGQFPARSSRRRLSDLGLRPKKRLSQSFLEDERVAAAIVRAAEIRAGSEVLEVGPGLGVLTRVLARRASRVVAVELDSDLAAALQVDMPDVEVVNEDVLKFQPAMHFERAYTVVANLPYHITSPAVRHLLQSGPPFARRLIVMVQAEVAERIAANAGEMSALAVAIQAQARVRVVQHVKATAFYPRPKVDSAVLALDPISDDERLIRREEIGAFTTMVQAGFKQPRKTLANSLSDGLGMSKPEAIARLDKASIDPGVRPQSLSIHDWARLFRTT